MAKDFMAPVSEKHTYTVNGQVVDKATYDKNKVVFDQEFAAASGSTTTPPNITTSGSPPVINKPSQSVTAPVNTKGKDTSPDKTVFNPAKDSQAAYENMNEKIVLEFTPNILDNYDVFTYHWKLFLVPLDAAYSGHVLDSSVQTIIAESGVSDLTIDKVEILGITCPSAEAGTGTMTTVKFEIVEPSGAGLLDKIFYQTVSLGIGNWMVTPYFLQLEFRGRDPYTEETIINGGPTGLGSLKWVWPIKLTDSKVNVTHVGTRYEFSAVMYDELAQSNSYFVLQHNTVLKQLTTFESAMIDLENKLNADQYEKLIDNYSIPDTFEIIVDPDLANIPLVNPDGKKSTSRGADFVDLSKKSASFTQGTGIDKVIDNLLGSTEYFQEKMQGSDTPSSEPKSSKNQKKQMKKLWRIITETKPIAFDDLRQDNAVAITIFVVQYDIGMLDATPAQTGQTPDTRDAATNRMKEYARKKILNKKYNYIFTGLNDQIISLDLNMNYSFAAALSRFGGIYYDSSTSSKGISQQDNAANEKKATEEVRKLLQFINNADKGTNVDAKIAEAKKAIANSKIDDTLKARYTAILDNAKPEKRRALTKQAQITGGIGAAGALNTSIKTAKSFSEGSLAASVNGLTFVSDVNTYSQAAMDAKNIAESSRKGKLRPIPYREAPQEGNFTGIDSDSNAGRSRTSSLFSTALYSTLDASMQHIKLTIKGDPFWLFPRSLSTDLQVLPYKSNMSTADAIKTIKTSHITQPDSVNIMGTDNFIVIRFRTPRIYNDTTGIADPYTEVETFSGVYKVVKITSKFDAGKFVQELDCILDPVINLADFLSSMESSSKTLDVTVPQGASITSTNAIKTQKIASGTLPPKGEVNTIRDLKGNVRTVNNSSNNTSNIPTATDMLRNRVA